MERPREKGKHFLYYSPKNIFSSSACLTQPPPEIFSSRKTHTNTRHGKSINNESIWGEFSLLKISNFTGFVCIIGCCHRKVNEKAENADEWESGKRETPSQYGYTKNLSEAESFQ